MITTVTLNPAFDRTLTLKRFRYGEVNRTDAVREDLGGKGINVAKILKSLGDETCAIGFLGEGNLGSFRHLLDQEGLKHEFIPVAGKTRTNLKLIETSSHLTTDINEPGFSVSGEQIADLGKKIQGCARNSHYVVFSGSIPKGAPDDLYKTLMKMVGGTARTVLDADGAILLAGLEAGPYLIKPNREELEKALGMPLDSTAKLTETARGLIRRYGITYVLISMGGEGSLLVGEGIAYRAPALKVEVRGTVGAGDSMLAGFLHGLERGEGPMEALKWATACGALAVSREGTETFSLMEAQKLTSAVDIEEI